MPDLGGQLLEIFNFGKIVIRTIHTNRFKNLCVFLKAISFKTRLSDFLLAFEPCRRVQLIQPRPSYFQDEVPINTPSAAVPSSLFSPARGQMAFFERAGFYNLCQRMTRNLALLQKFCARPDPLRYSAEPASANPPAPL
jgi:hypothetical protein